MSIKELIKRINLIIKFTDKMTNESVPFITQKIFIKLYSNNLNFNLNDKMIENILNT
jgi:hypothetical protein